MAANQDLARKRGEDLRTAPSGIARGAVGFVEDYIDKTSRFSRNANLYVIHVIGMDMIHGSFDVLFNLYLLAIGFDIRFIGLRLLIGFIARALTAIPAGLLSDRIGRKASFILGDGIGAIIGVIAISTRNEALLLALPAVGALFGNLHHTSEAAFMAENSKPAERVHLFAVSGSLRTFSAMTGALIAGLIPAFFIDDIGRVDAYRYATYAGLSLWFLSLIPALMLRSHEAEERPEEQFRSDTSARQTRGIRNLFSGITHPRRIVYFVITSAFASIAFAIVAPMFAVVLHEGDVHAGEGQIGVMFAVAQLSLAVVTLGTPLLAARMLRVDAIALTRLAAIPFILGIGLMPLIFDEGGVLLLLVAMSYVGRVGFLRMASPLDDSFNMDVLDAKERATNTGLEIAVGSGLSAIAILIGSRLLDSGDFTTPFLIMAVASVISTAIYWRVFRRLEISELKNAELDSPTAPQPDTIPTPAD
ncbi:MAG: MFS transporter [Chloroflexi bacterium]|nr:MFS transporter [Chloroflexota bacterium]